MRILFVNDYAEAVGGVEVYDQQLIRLLRERGHEVAFFGGERPDSYYRQFVRSFYSPKHRREVVSLVDSFRPDIVFAHSICYNVSPSFLQPIRERGIPITFTIPELAQLSYQFPKVPWYLVPASFARKFVQRRMVTRHVDRFIVPSKTAARHVRGDLGVDAVEYIPHPSFWDVVDEAQSVDSKKILFVGRLDEIKGVETLVDAFAEVVDAVPGATLEIVGRGPMEGSLRAQAASTGTTESIEFRGFVDHDEIKERYREAAVFVLPTVIEENCPMTVLEALSQGVPVVTTDLGGQRELVADSGAAVVVPPGDSAQLADALTRVLSDEALRQDLSEAARRHAGQFTPQRHVEQLEELFEDLVEDHGGRE